MRNSGASWIQPCERIQEVTGAQSVCGHNEAVDMMDEEEGGRDDGS